MHRAFQLIQDEALDADFRASAQELLQLLLTRKSYTKARESRARAGKDALAFRSVRDTKTPCGRVAECTKHVAPL